MAIYKAFFQLQDSPFRLTPDPDFLYMTVQHREALSGLVHSVCSHSGLTVLVGEAGTGKTTLIQALRNWLERLNFTIVICNNPIMSREELYDMLIMQLNVDCTSSFKNRQLMALDEKLRKRREEGRRTVLIVDEAHKLPADLLEEVRLLLNLETAHEKLLEIILAGQPELMSLLRQDELRQLKQRVSSFCRLHPLRPEELREYVHHRLAQAGRPQQTIFPDETLQLVHTYTQGIPRVVNTLCESALLLGFALQSRVVTCEMLAEAAADMDLIPEKKGAALSVAPLAVSAPSPSATLPVAEASSGKENVRPEQTTARTQGAVAVMPMESYTTRQKSLGFLAGLLDRWK